MNAEQGILQKFIVKSIRAILAAVFTAIPSFEQVFSRKNKIALCIDGVVDSFD
jgi:hypothetical protein